MPAVFLRFEAPRLRIALPYASLLSVELALDEEQLDLAYATHRVTVRGRKLVRIYQAICEGMAVQVAVATEGAPLDARSAPLAPWVGEIRVNPVEDDE